jgi:uroporphyrinogen decarboxylase
LPQGDISSLAHSSFRNPHNPGYVRCAGYRWDGLWKRRNPSNPRPSNNSIPYLRLFKEVSQRVNQRPNLMRVLAGEALGPPPIWIMRQAGRYLPEYRETRKRVGSFLELCFTPELAAEVTLQPIRRFDFDAAILFSDILVVPYALGQGVRFVEGEGPVLEPLAERLDSLRLDDVEEKLAPVSGTVRLVRRELSANKALIGFCGAPWTVATYMIAGRGVPEQLPARRLAAENPERLQALIDILVEASVRYLLAQIEAGADVVKLFDTWAGALDEEGWFERWAIKPAQTIIERVRAVAPWTPIIAFPRGAGDRLGTYAQETKADAIAVDWMTPMQQARDLVAAPTALQGNLDPSLVVEGGSVMDEGIDAILSAMRGRAHIFNLGHGITPDAPLDHVARLVERVRSGRDL